MALIGKIDSIVIFGGHVQALGLARQASAVGLHVILCLDDGMSIARFSKSVNKVFVYSNKTELSTFIKSLYSEEKHILLFPTNDEAIEYLSDNFQILEEHFYVGIPEPQVVNIFTDKRKTWDFACRNGISAPKTWCLSSIADVDTYEEEFEFPVIIKPSEMYTFHSTFGKKAFLCHDIDELKTKIVELTGKFPIDKIMVQEFLQGGPKNLYSYACFAANGVPKVAIIANRIRQNPYLFGNSTTFAVTKYVPEIENESKKILLATKYTGLAEIEFMYDSNSECYKFLEINTRAWKWHTISENFNFGFLAEYVKFSNGIPSSPKVDYSEPRAWVERITDFAVSLKAVSKGMLSINEIYQSYKLKKTSAVWSSKDIFPALMYLFMSPILFFKRH